MSRLAALLAIAALAAGTLAAQASAQTSDATLPDLEDEVMCVVCGTTLGMSESRAADGQREFIRDRIAEGLGKEEIKEALVAEYGPEVLAVPDTAGFDIAAWVVPGLALLVAAVALFLGIRRWRRRTPSDEPPPAPGSSGDEERLASDLGRYDL